LVAKPLDEIFYDDHGLCRHGQWSLFAGRVVKSLMRAVNPRALTIPRV
jgi:hypothetical protein